MSDEFEVEAERLFDCAHNNMGWKPIEESLRKAYAGGLAALAAVRAEEREACAKVADNTDWGGEGDGHPGPYIAAAIRARNP